MKSVNRKAPFQCPMCHKQYSKKYVLKAHMNVSHDGVKRYQCYFCFAAIFTESDMIEHMFNHTKEKPYKCQYCNQWYRKEDSVNKHKNGKTCSRKLTYQLPCYFCGKVFLKRRILMSHMKTVHLKEELKQCNLCCKYFSSTIAINRHIRTVHLLERNYQCQLCSKKFGRNEELKNHIQIGHTKEKPFKCYFCSISFVDLEHLKRHMLIHTREKPLTCYFCWKDFSDAYHLSAHIGKHHTKERPFQCVECPSRCYSTKGTFNEHVRRKHGSRVEQ
jgi:KRAB domain-containing zinc finger protein